jgi:hypothetical protein
MWAINSFRGKQRAASPRLEIEGAGNHHEKE